MPAPSRPPARDAAGRRKAEKSLKRSRPGWTAGERGVGAVSGSRRAQTPRTPNPDTSTGTDHVRGHNDAPTHTHNQTRAPTPGPCPLPQTTDTQRHGQMHVPGPNSQRPTNARVRTKTPEAPADAHGPGSEPLSPGGPPSRSGFLTLAEPRASGGRCRRPGSGKS